MTRRPSDRKSDHYERTCVKCGARIRMVRSAAGGGAFVALEPEPETFAVLHTYLGGSDAYQTVARQVWGYRRHRCPAS